MYQNCCKKCGSMSLHTENKGNNTGLYCNDCGAWLKWLGKDELRAFNYVNEESSVEGHKCGICKFYETDECKNCQRNYPDLFERR